MPDPVTVNGRTSGRISSGSVTVASPDLSSSTPRLTSRPGRRLTVSHPVESESCCTPTDDASASGPTGSAPLALTVTYAGCTTGTSHASSTRTFAAATVCPSATRVSRLAFTAKRAGSPVTWTAIESRRSAPQEFFMRTRSRCGPGVRGTAMKSYTPSIRVRPESIAVAPS